VISKRRHAIIGSLLLLIGLSSSAFAHSPYFGQIERMVHPKFAIVKFAVLYGDGVLLGDPSRVVIIDSAGYLLAATPLSKAFIVRCDRADGASTCRIYDALRGLVFEPNYDQWARRGIIEEEGKPTAYPEWMDIEYGFTKRLATFIEIVTLEAKGILISPIGSILSILWWGVACSFASRQVWRWKYYGWKMMPFKVDSVFMSALGVLVFIGMSALAFYGWILNPYSVYYFIFTFPFGALLSIVLSRPKVSIGNM
jgi:hypothetical protein